MVAWFTALAALAPPNYLDEMGRNQIKVDTPDGFYGYTGDGGNISKPHINQFTKEGMLFQS
jgi:hypothetical protein